MLSPAVNPVAETLMAAESTDHEPALAPIIAAPIADAEPMSWEEAVGWLSQRSAETRNFVGQYWNWDYDLRVLHFLAQQPELDAGVAAHIFWLTAACEDYLPFGDDEPDSEIARQIAWLTNFLGHRFAEGAFRSTSYGFDDSWDCERMKELLNVSGVPHSLKPGAGTSMSVGGVTVKGYDPVAVKAALKAAGYPEKATGNIGGTDDAEAAPVEDMSVPHGCIDMTIRVALGPCGYRSRFSRR